MGISHEPATSLVDIEPVLQPARARCELIAAARHIQVRTTVPVGIEEQRPPIRELLVGRPGLTVCGFDEAAVLPLNEQLARDTCRAANEDVVQAVAVHVAHGNGRALAGRLVWQERLDTVIGDGARLVPVLQHSRLLESWWRLVEVGGGSGGCSVLCCLSLFQDQRPINVQISQ